MSASEELRDAGRKLEAAVEVDHIVALDPTAAVALSDWLYHTAWLIASNKGRVEGVQSSVMALRVARAINGDTP